MKNLTILLIALFLSACGENSETIYVTPEPEISPTLQTLTIHIDGSGCPKSTVVAINGEDTLHISGGTTRDVNIYTGTYTIHATSYITCAGIDPIYRDQSVEVIIKEGSNHVYFD